MRNPNVRILLIAFVLIAAVAACGLFVFREGPVTQERVSPEAPVAAENTAAKAWLRVQGGDLVWEPIALADGDSYTITQPDGKENVVHVTATGAVMHSSTCDNQSCVHQGWATLENRDSRVLGGLIICLPNEIVLEVLSAQEAQAQEGMK